MGRNSCWPARGRPAEQGSPGDGVPVSRPVTMISSSSVTVKVCSGTFTQVPITHLMPRRAGPPALVSRRRVAPATDSLQARGPAWPSIVRDSDSESGPGVILNLFLIDSAFLTVEVKDQVQMLWRQR